MGLGLEVVVQGAESPDDEAGEDTSPEKTTRWVMPQDKDNGCTPWRHYVPPSDPPQPRDVVSHDFSGARITRHAEGECRSVFGAAQAVAEESPVFLDIEERGLEPGMLILELPEPEPIHTPDESPEAFQQRWNAWKERDRARAQRLSLDVVQERLNAPARRVTGRQTNHTRHPAARVLVTRALRALDQPHPELVLAGQLLPDHTVVGHELPDEVAAWITRVATDPELLREFTADPDAPAHLAGIGLTPDSVLLTQDLVRLKADIGFALLHEAGSALWDGDSARLNAAIDKIADERGLDATELRAFAQDEVAAQWRRCDLLYTGIAVAFVAGRQDGIRWATKLDMKGRRSWIQPWVQRVAAVVFHVQHTPHWKSRALNFGGFRSPSEAQRILAGISRFEREFIRLRIGGAFAVGAHRCPRPSLGVLTQRVRALAPTRRPTDMSATVSPTAA
jgi:hypothetical protein